MYAIETTHWGLRLTFGGAMNREEMSRWLGDLRKALTNQEDDFYVFVDMRTLIPLDKDTQVPMSEGQKLCQQKGMIRSVVILSSPVTAAQFRRIGGETGIGKFERYIDASSVPDWEEAGLNWLFNEVDPDTIVRTTAAAGD